MGLLTITGKTTATVIEGLIDMPLFGVWIADLSIDQIGTNQFVAGQSVSLQTEEEDFGLSLNGTVVPDRNGSFLDTVHVRVIGGANGLSKIIPPKAFQNATGNDVLNYIASQSGEKLSSTIDASLKSVNISNWTITRGTASTALGVFLENFGSSLNWRFLSDGTLWSGQEQWSNVESDYPFQLLSQNPKDGYAVFGVEAPHILPGANIDGIGKVSRVVHEIKGNSIRTFIWTLIGQSVRTIQDSISALVLDSLPQIDFLARYNAKVVSQRSNGNLDIQPDDQRLPGYSNIPIRYGDPSTSVKVQPGGYVQLAFDGGNPRNPFVEAWLNGTTVSELDLSAIKIVLNDGTNGTITIQNGIITLNGGLLAVARQTDKVTGTAGPYPVANGVITTGNNTIKA